ncbi:MAG: hypothetical protein E7616_05465 [Ruminococcaceae bacterium]|nr:hypothetical protein [Oscillospiraceae bacterium]
MKKGFLEKAGAFIKKHWVFFTVLAVIFVSSFFIRGRSVQMQYVGADSYEYVRLDYSIYGYCVGVSHLQEKSVQTAKDLSRQVLLMDMDSSIQYIADQWVYYHGDQETFKFKVKGYIYNTNDRRDEIIWLVKDMGYKADAIV